MGFCFPKKVSVNQRLIWNSFGLLIGIISITFACLDINMYLYWSLKICIFGIPQNCMGIECGERNFFQVVTYRRETSKMNLRQICIFNTSFLLLLCVFCLAKNPRKTKSAYKKLASRSSQSGAKEIANNPSSGLSGFIYQSAVSD